METIPKSECIKIGYLKKTHGVNGDLVLEFDPEFETAIENSAHFFVELDGLLVPFFIAENGFRFKTDDTAIVSFDDVETEKYAKRMVGMAVFLYKKDIGESNSELNVNFEGYSVIDQNLGELGEIVFIDNYSGNIVITINYKGNELLVPFNEDLLIEMDNEHRKITLNLPDGLVE